MTLLEDACELFLLHCETEKKLSPLTIRAYRGDLACFLKAVGDKRPLAEFAETWIEAAVKAWSADGALKMITVKRRTACVKALVRWLFRRRLIAFNPLERIHLEFRLPKRLPRNLKTDEIRKLISIKPDSVAARFEKDGETRLSRREWDQLTARLAIEVLTLTGVRIGELVKVHLADLDFDLRQIRILGKGNRDRYVHFPDEVTTARLKAYKGRAASQFAAVAVEQTTLFLNGMGKPANEQYLRRVIRLYAEDAELARRITPHMLRHTAATQLLEAGLDIRLVQRQLGHSSITTTEIYTHVADHVLRSEISRVNVRGRLEIE